MVRQTFTVFFCQYPILGPDDTSASQAGNGGAGRGFLGGRNGFKPNFSWQHTVPTYTAFSKLRKDASRLTVIVWSKLWLLLQHSLVFAFSLSLESGGKSREAEEEGLGHGQCFAGRPSGVLQLDCSQCRHLSQPPYPNAVNRDGKGLRRVARAGDEFQLCSIDTWALNFLLSGLQHGHWLIEVGWGSGEGGLWTDREGLRGFGQKSRVAAKYL